MDQQFTSAQVVRLTGITPRQLQWWDERGIVVPRREGRRRLYTADDITEIAVICALRRKGFPLQRVRRIMKFLQKELGRRLAEAVSNGSEYHLLTDGKRVYLENSQREVIDVLKNSRQPLLGLCLSDAVREVRAEIFTRRPAQKQGARRSGRRKSS
ncbi:MAG TPA: MerR family transcriptional regulator [Candidatus Angelobacter sp.]|nr:MerR family transcriptional regulator [Candidatus Angelobacter sp.]